MVLFTLRGQQVSLHTASRRPTPPLQEGVRVRETETAKKAGQRLRAARPCRRVCRGRVAREGSGGLLSDRGSGNPKRVSTEPAHPRRWDAMPRRRLRVPWGRGPGRTCSRSRPNRTREILLRLAGKANYRIPRAGVPPSGRVPRAAAPGRSGGAATCGRLKARAAGDGLIGSEGSRLVRHLNPARGKAHKRLPTKLEVPMPYAPRKSGQLACLEGGSGNGRLRSTRALIGASESNGAWREKVLGR